MLLSPAAFGYVRRSPALLVVLAARISDQPIVVFPEDCIQCNLVCYSCSCSQKVILYSFTTENFYFGDVYWAYRSIHDAIVPYRHIIAGSLLSWLIQLPDSVEILCSTAEEGGEIVTECSATCINYKDFETKKIRRSFTCQFHPELLEDLRAIGNGEAPSYSTLKKDDGVRLFVRLLYAGMQE